jgi:hypothetical protein
MANWAAASSAGLKSTKIASASHRDAASGLGRRSSAVVSTVNCQKLEPTDRRALHAVFAFIILISYESTASLSRARRVLQGKRLPLCAQLASMSCNMT